MSKIVDVYVHGEHSSGNTLICSMSKEKNNIFYLAKKHIIDPRKYRKHAFNTFEVTDFGWKSHRQLCGDEIFEREKARRKEWKKSQ